MSPAKSSLNSTNNSWVNLKLKSALAFLIPLLYWAYLYFNAQMDIKHDAVGYEHLGRLLYTEGWSEYFRLGPYREPLYPFLVSVSMQLADFFHVNYQSIQKLIQISILLITQISIFKILHRLKIHEPIIFLMGV